MDPAAELAALEREILADPEPDAPRARLGELLRARADPRGRLIELQLMAIARWRRGDTPPPRVRQELDSLLALHGARWAAPVARDVDAWELRRGFVEHVTLDARAWLTGAARLYAAAPIRHLSLTNVRPVLAMVMASPHLARLRSLGLAGTALGDDGVAALAHSPYVGGLRWLDLREVGLTRVGLDALASSPCLGALRFVRLTGNPSGDPTPQPPAGDGWAAWPDLDLPPLGRELLQRHGPRPWLTTPPGAWPADRDYDP